MTPGYDSQVICRDCNCEDFPCCGHGITANDVFESDEYREWRDDIAGEDE